MHRREPLRREPRRHRVHPHFRIDQHVRTVGRDGGAPAVDRQRPAYEPLAERGSLVGRGVALRAGVIAEQAKALAVEACHPALDRDLPVGVLTEEAADDAEAHGLARLRRRWQLRRRIALGHEPADQRAVARLQCAVVQALIGQVERLVRTDAVGETGCAAAICIVAKCFKLRRIGGTAGFDLRLVFVDDRELRHAGREPRLGMVGRDRKHLPVRCLRLRPAVEATQAVAAQIERLDMIGLGRERALIGGERVVVAVHFLQRPPVTTERVGMVALHRQRALVARNRVVDVMEREQHVGAAAERLYVIRAQRQRRVVARRRLLRAAERQQHMAAIGGRLDIAGTSRAAPAGSSPAPPPTGRAL